MLEGAVSKAEAGLSLRLGRIASILLLSVIAGSLLLAPPAAAKETVPPPVLDRELFFGDPEISAAQLSPDGQFIAFIKPLKGTRNVWVKRTDQPFDAARPVTADTHRPIPGYFWSRDGKFILFAQDKDGDENYNIYAVNPADPPSQGSEVPAARNLTDLKGVRAMIYAVPKTDPDVIYVGINDRDASWHDLYRVKISTAERTLVRKNTDRVASWFFDNKGQLRLALRVADNGDTEVLRVDEGGFTKIYSCSVFETCGPVRFHKDNQRIYMTTNKGEGIDLTRLVLFDPQSAKEEMVESDPKNRVDFGDAMFSEVSDELVATTYDDDRIRIYWKDKGFETDYKRLKKELPGKDLSVGSVTKDEQLWLIAAGGDTEPGERYLFDRRTKKLTFQYRIFEKLPRAQLASMEAVRYKSVDGMEIPAFLSLPKGVPPKNLPAMIVPHGGPWYRDSWGYDAFAQFLANRGYAVLQPNFRGSTGYGKKFLNSANKEWGQRMQDDLTWGVKYLVARGIADPKRVGIMGGSYGGYATLAGVTFTPDLYAAAVSIVGPSNLNTLLESIPPYWEAIRKIFLVRMGDPATPEGKALLDRQSPLNSADKIKTPLLVVQGANDPRVKRAESDRIVMALRDRGFPVEYLVASDEGHGFARPINNLAMFASAEKFLAKHLGGRYQESMTPEVASQLAAITVDVKTVTLTKTVDAATVGLPRPVNDLVAGTYKYQVRLEANGQSFPMSVTREIAPEGGGWAVTDKATTPMGEIQDRTVLEKGSLAVISRSVRQGPVTVDITVKDGKATGNIHVGEQVHEVSADLGGALFADGAGSNEVLATLPLADGYSATFRNLDVQRQKARLMQLKVAGIETVAVPAGSFEAYRLEITSAEGDPGKTTVWTARDTRKVVKSVSVVPELGGAVMTSELLP